MSHPPRGEKGWPEKQVNDLLDQPSFSRGNYRRLVERLPAIIYTAELGAQGR
ncbi:MAG: hypothetical protein ACHQCF_03425 [Solirubrobacterales bacterium]